MNVKIILLNVKFNLNIKIFNLIVNKLSNIDNNLICKFL